MIYLLHGENEFEKRQKLAAIVGGSSQARYDGERLDEQEFRQLLRSQTLFDEDAPIVVAELSGNAELWTKLPIIAENTDKTLILLETKPDKRTKTYKWLAKNATMQACEALTERQRSVAEQWLVQYAADHNVALTRAQVGDMVGRAMVSGENDRTLTIDQLQLTHAVAALAHVGEVNDQAIAAVLPPAREYSVFDILDLAAHQRANEVRQALDELRSRDDAYKIMALLWSQWSQLAAVTLASGATSSQIATELSLHPYVAKKLQTLSRLFTSEELHKLTTRAAELDYLSKTASIAPWQIVEQFVLSVAMRTI